jgi:hypothetical protein
VLIVAFTMTRALAARLLLPLVLVVGRCGSHALPVLRSAP